MTPAVDIPSNLASISTKRVDIFDQVDQWAREIAEGAVTRDLNPSVPVLEFQRLKSTDILAARLPIQYGGAGLSVADITHIIQTIATADPNVGQILGVHFAWIEDLLIHSSSQQQTQFGEIVRKGALIAGAQAELGGKSGSDISTTLLKDNDNFILHGRKYYCTGGAVADYLNVLAVNEVGDLICAIIPADRAGITIFNDWDGIGQRTTSSGTITFDQVVVKQFEIIGAPESRKRWTHFWSLGHVLHAAVDAGIAHGALNDASDYVRNKARPSRESGCQNAVEDPFILQSFGNMVISANTATAMGDRAARFVDVAADCVLSGGTGEAIVAEAGTAVAEAKVVCAESALRVSETLFSLGGGGGTRRDLGLDRHWRNARTHTTHDPLPYKYKAVGSYYLANPTTAGKSR